MSNKKGCCCLGCGCGFLLAIIVALLIALIAAGIWAKNRFYVRQPEKINEVAEQICEFKLPEEFQPLLAFDFNIIKFAMFIYGEENKVAMVQLVELPKGREAEKMFSSAYIEGVTSEISAKLGVENPQERTVTTETLNSIVMVGTNTMKVTETKIRFEEDDVTMLMRQGVFFKGDKTVIAIFLATEGPDTNARATQFLQSVKP